MNLQDGVFNELGFSPFPRLYIVVRFDMAIDCSHIQSVHTPSVHATVD